MRGDHITRSECLLIELVSYNRSLAPCAMGQHSERAAVCSLEESPHHLTSDYTKKLQSSKQYGAGTKTEILIDGKG